MELTDFPRNSFKSLFFPSGVSAWLSRIINSITIHWNSCFFPALVFLLGVWSLWVLKHLPRLPSCFSSREIIPAVLCVLVKYFCSNMVPRWPVLLLSFWKSPWKKKRILFFHIGINTTNKSSRNEAKIFGTQMFGSLCAERFSKPWPYNRPKYMIFHITFQTWPRKSAPHFRPSFNITWFPGTGFRLHNAPLEAWSMSK